MLRTTVLAAASLVAWAGCSAPAAEVRKDDMMPDPILQGNKKGALTVEKGDVSGDGKPDVWNYIKEIPDPSDPAVPLRVVVRKEADVNFDGKKDITREFDDEGVLVREEADLDYDGQIDQVVLYDKGILKEKQLSRTGATRPFIWKYFEEGKMVRLSRDDTNDGIPDYCELWYAGEKLSRRGWDKNGDGECDFWENAD